MNTHLCVTAVMELLVGQDDAAANGAALLWRSGPNSSCPIVGALPDGTYRTVLIKPSICGVRRDRILAAAHRGQDLTEFAGVREKGSMRRGATTHGRWPDCCTAHTLTPG